MPQSIADVLVAAGQQLENDIFAAIQRFKDATGTAPSAVLVDIQRVDGVTRDHFTPKDVRVTVEA